MESMERAVKGFFDLSRMRLITARDITKAIRIAILESSREQAINATKAELFSDVRLGEGISDLPDSVGFLSKIIRNGGVEEFKEAVGRIRALTAGEEDSILRTENALIGALWLAELFRTKVIKADVIQRATEIALRTPAEEAAGSLARYELGKELVQPTRDLWCIFHTEGSQVFNKLTTHIWRLVIVDYQERRIPEFGETIFRPSFREWRIVVSDLPRTVAWTWILYSAPSAEISGSKGITAEMANKSGHGWLDSLAVVVGLRGSTAIALCKQDDVFYVLQRDFSRGGGW